MTGIPWQAWAMAWIAGAIVTGSTGHLRVGVQHDARGDQPALAALAAAVVLLLAWPVVAAIAWMRGRSD